MQYALAGVIGAIVVVGLAIFLSWLDMGGHSKKTSLPEEQETQKLNKR